MKQREREAIRLGMRRKWERTRDMDTMRRPSRHVGGDSSHLTPFAFQEERYKGLLLLLTCAGVTSDAMPTQHNNQIPINIDSFLLSRSEADNATNFGLSVGALSPSFSCLSLTTPLFSQRYCKCKYTLSNCYNLILFFFAEN